jgi:hypothetical protein
MNPTITIVYECNVPVNFSVPNWNSCKTRLSLSTASSLSASVTDFRVCRLQNQRQKQDVFDSDLVFVRDALQIALETKEWGEFLSFQPRRRQRTLSKIHLL